MLTRTLNDPGSVLVAARIQKELRDIVYNYVGQLNTPQVRELIKADIINYINQFTARGYMLVDEYGKHIRHEDFVDERGMFTIPKGVFLAF